MRSTLAKKKHDGPDFSKLYPLVIDEILRNNDGLESHLKLFLLALSGAKPNGHAPFKRGSLAKLLGQPGKPHTHVKRVIAKAVKLRLLSGESVPTCLVLPSFNTGDEWGVWPLAHPYDKSSKQNAKHWPCAIHDGFEVPNVTALCHPDRKHHANTLCHACYQAKWKSERG